MLRSFGHVSAAEVQQGVTMLNVGMRTSLIFITQHVATGWPASLNMLRPTMLLYFASECCDPLTGACKCWASNVGIYCAEMLRSFGRGLNCQPAFAMKKTECQMVGYKKDALTASKACDHQNIDSALIHFFSSYLRS